MEAGHPPYEQPPIPAPAQPSAPVRKARAGRPLVAVALSLVVIAAVAVAAIVIYNKTSKAHAITRAQWQSVSFGSTAKEMTSVLGKKPSGEDTSEFGNRPSYIAVYNDGRAHTTAVFNFSQDRLFSKAWSHYKLSDTTITATERAEARRMAARGVTQSGFERRFGQPAERTTAMSSARYLPPAYRRMFASGRTKCIAWLLASDKSRKFEMCFDPATHKALSGSGAPLGLRGALRPLG